MLDVLWKDAIQEFAKHWPVWSVLLVIGASLLTYLLRLAERYWFHRRLASNDAYVGQLNEQIGSLKAQLAFWQQRMISSSEGEARSLRQELAKTEGLLNASREREVNLVREKEILKKRLTSVARQRDESASSLTQLRGELSDSVEHIKTIEALRAIWAQRLEMLAAKHNLLWIPIEYENMSPYQRSKQSGWTDSLLEEIDRELSDLRTAVEFFDGCDCIIDNS